MIDNPLNPDGSAKRAFIQFPKHFLSPQTHLKPNQPSSNIPKGFLSFRQINKSNSNQIISTIKKFRSKSNLHQFNKQIQSEILFNKKSFEDINIFCDRKKDSERKGLLERLKQMQHAQISKNVKAIKRNQKQQKQQTMIKLSINYHVLQSNITKSKPYIDYDSTNFALGSKGYFYSGRKQMPVVIYDRAENKWEEQEVEKLKPFGQSCPSILNKQEVIFFGGIRFFQQGISVIMNDIQVFNIKTKINNIIKFDESAIASRAFHAQCIYGQFLLISGGIDKNYKTMKSFCVFNYVKNYWNELEIAKKPLKFDDGLSKHKIVPVFHKRKRYLIYEETPIQQNYDIKEQGVYIFGGEDSNVELSDKLYLLTLGTTELEIRQLNPKGQAPLARKNFAIIRFKQYLLTHGGKNDEMTPYTLFTFHFLDLKQLEWKKVTGDKHIGRYGHGLINYNDSQIVIFGGKNQEGICKQIYSLSVQEQLIRG